MFRTGGAGGCGGFDIAGGGLGIRDAAAEGGGGGRDGTFTGDRGASGASPEVEAATAALPEARTGGFGGDDDGAVFTEARGGSEGFFDVAARGGAALLRADLSA